MNFSSYKGTKKTPTIHLLDALPGAPHARVCEGDCSPLTSSEVSAAVGLVGPRPEVPRYVELFAEDYAEILRVRPGITDLASIKYRDEAAVLALADDPHAQYVQHVLPEKIELAKEYIRRSSLPLDLSIIVTTIVIIVRDRIGRRKCDAVVGKTPESDPP
ncbi:MAG: sugar transferase [Candidatus Nealsonbacteria bacterium]|nr:sugar transferase [Candidatus Nealsonbacteria bacterium]